MTVGAALARSVSTGNGSTTEFPFNAPVAAATEIKVYTVVIATGVQTLQTKDGSGTYDYSVAINASTNYATVTVNTALPDTHKIVIMRNVPLTQETDYVEGDAFGAETHEAALDKLTMIAAQISEVADRSIKVQETSATTNITCAELVADKVLVVNSDGDGISMGPTTANLDTLAGISSDITTVAGISSNVTSVAGNATNINAVAADATDIGAVADKATEIGRLGTADAVADLAILGTADAVSDMNTLGTSANVTNMNTLAGIASNITTVAGISSNVTTVAGISSNVTTVAGVASDVTTVAGVSSNVTTVAGIASNVTTVATNISDVNTFANVYRIGSSDPSSSLDEGDLFYNTTSNALKYYNGSAWINIDSGDLDFQADSGGALSIEDNETLTFTGGTGIDTSGSGNAVTFAIDSTVATLSGSQTLTNKSGNISQWTNDSSYLTANQTITLSGDVSGSGTTAITVTVADDSHNHVISNVDGLQTALDAKLANVAEDTTPQLGGNLDVNGNDIVSTSNANIDIVPNGTGDVTLQADTVQVGDSNANATVTTNGTGDLILNTNAGTNSGNITIADGSNGNISVTPNGTGNVSLGNLTFDADQTVGSGQDNYVLTYDNSGGVIGLEAAAGGGGGLEVISAVNNYNATGDTTSYSFTGFDSTYDNYYVIIHAISQHGQGDIQLRFLDDGSALTNSDYRQTTLGLTDSNSEKRITTTAEDKITLVQQTNSGDKDPFNGWMYFNNGRGGRWDSDSNDSEGEVSPSVVYMLGGEGSNGSSRIAIGHGYLNDTQANTCNGFQLLFAGGDGAHKVNLTVYGVKRS